MVKKGELMEIKRDKYYVIAKISDDKSIEDYFNLRVYSGRYVMLAYNQIPNKEEYCICSINPKKIENNK